MVVQSHRLRRCLYWRLLCPILLVASAPALGQSSPVTYTAEYQAFYKGRNVGTSIFSVRRDEESGLYVYESATSVKGLLRLASPKPAIDRSHFEFSAGKILPHEFWHQDGSRKGEDNQQIVFDWAVNEATLSGEFGTRKVSIEKGTLDRGSLQVAITADLNSGVEPSQYLVADDDSIKAYRYTSAGEKRIGTGMGDVAVVSYVQQRDGSSRQTIIDLGRDYHYIPMRIEQIRDGESQSAFVLESLQIDD